MAFLEVIRESLWRWAVTGMGLHSKKAKDGTEAKQEKMGASENPLETIRNYPNQVHYY